MKNRFENIYNLMTGKLERLRILVVGDVMLDRYYFGEVKRISPEAPVPVARIQSEKDVLGGAANVAHNLAGLGCQVDLLGLTGQDDSQVRLKNLLKEINVTPDLLIPTNKPTITKLRILGGHQQMMRLDFEDSSPIGRKIENQIICQARDLLEQGVQALILSDYAKGVLTIRVCRELIHLAQKKEIPILVDPKGNQWKKYNGASFITPNLKELGEAARKNLDNQDRPITQEARKILQRIELQGLIVTRSEQGISLVSQKDELHIPTVAQEVFDVSGAGDTVLAVLGAALAGQLPVQDAIRLANLAAGIVVGKLGTYAIQRQQLFEAVMAYYPKEEIV